MRIFVFESITAGEFKSESEGNVDNTSLSAMESLTREGLAMLNAIVPSLRQLGHTVELIWDAQLSQSPPVAEQVTSAESSLRIETLFQQACERADAVLIIAPEFQGCLLRWIELAGRFPIRLLGPHLEFAKVAGDKWLTWERWLARRVPTPVTFLTTDPSLKTAVTSFDRFLVKPRFGAGSDGIQIVDALELAEACRVQSFDNSITAANQLIAQPLIEGTAVSVGIVGHGHKKYVCPPALQLLSDDGSCHYLGGVVPAPDVATGDIQQRALQAVEALGPFHGYVGVDLLVEQETNHVWAIEINPRLTTSFVGLSRLIPKLVQYWLVEVAPISSPESIEATVRFSKEGEVTMAARQISI